MSKDSLGIINWWGFSPALNLLDSDVVKFNEIDDVNILLIGPGDARHVLKTISKLYTNHYQTINFYIVENGIELYARYLIQLCVSLLPNNKLGLQDKTEMFLELYGNSLIREHTMEFGRKFANEMINIITDPEECATKLPLVNLDHLKFKEKDILEHIYKIWKYHDPKSFDAALCWDLRLRHNLGVRYDAIPNVFDWDCSMILHDRGAPIVNSREYGHWRHKGVAFQLRDATYDVSNRTLASNRVLMTPGGDRTMRLGYWGDIVCSPYLGFGIISDNEELFKKMNCQFTCGSERISEYNVTEMMYEIMNRRKYIERKEEKREKKTLTITEEDYEDVENEENKEEDNITSSTQDKPTKSIIDSIVVPPSVKIHFLPINSLSDYLPRKSQFSNFFKLAYISTSLVGTVDSCTSFQHMLHPEAAIIAETPQFIVSINNDQLSGFNTRLCEILSTNQIQKSTTQPQILEKSGHILFYNQPI